MNGYASNFSSFISTLFWVFIFFALIIPYLRQKSLKGTRISLMRAVKKEKQNPRVVATIYIQKTINFLEVPIVKHINIEDSEEILRVVRITLHNIFKEMHALTDFYLKNSDSLPLTQYILFPYKNLKGGTC